MKNLIIEPLKFYDAFGREQIVREAEQVFDGLVKSSSVDVTENRKTAAEYRKLAAIAEGTNKKIKRLKVLKGFLIAFTVLGFLSVIIGIFLSSLAQILCISIGLAVAIFCILIISLKVNKVLKSAKDVYAKQKAKADSVYNIALNQMSALNALFTERQTHELIEKVLPNIKFEEYFSTELHSEFCKRYSYLDGIDKDRSVVNTVSGRYNGNPFLFLRYIDHHIGTKDYHGTLVISWTERVRDSDGRVRTVRRTQTLHAMVLKPYPYYNYKTELLYGHQCSPDLNFSRTATDVEELSEKQVARRVRKGEKKLKKMSEKALKTGDSFTEMANSEFDVLFGALDRDNEVQFRVMYTPLAQQNTVDLLVGDDIGYGDDFDFIKHGKYNKIVSEHAQRWNMDTSANNYYSYDIDIAKQNFLEHNSKYFKSLFFDLAPLLSIPAYHEQPSVVFDPIECHSNYSYYEHEIMANVIGARCFKHEKSDTEIILKAKHLYSSGKTDCVEIAAHSYTGIPRVDFIPTLGGDGRMHAVPVPWVEYVPVCNVTNIAVKRVGLTQNEFFNKANENKSYERLKQRPMAYYHGLYARIIDGVDVKNVDSDIENIIK